MIKRATLIILSALVCALCGCAQNADDSLLDGYVSRTKQVFGDGIVFSAAVRGGNEQAALDDMAALLDRIDAEMSLSNEQSALSRFNALGDGEQPYDGYESERVQVSSATYEVIRKSMQYYEDTAGLFNVAVYPLAKLWHVDTDGLNTYAFADPSAAPAPPAAEQVESTVAACDMRSLHCEESDGAYCIYKTDPRLKIDLGAVAKGYAADECIRIAKAYGVQSAMINLSGNISLLGEWYRPEQKAYTRWNVGVLAPRPAKGLGGNVCALSVAANKTLVTSGDYERYYQTASGDSVLWVPHIVNANTGLPLGVAYENGAYVNTSDHIISATVISDDSAQADAYATAVCLMGKQAGAQFLRAHGMGGILITNDGAMCLVNVDESGEDGETYFTLKNEFDGYKTYTIEVAA